MSGVVRLASAARKTFHSRRAPKIKKSKMCIHGVGFGPRRLEQEILPGRSFNPCWMRDAIRTSGTLYTVTEMIMLRRLRLAVTRPIHPGFMTWLEMSGSGAKTTGSTPGFKTGLCVEAHGRFMNAVSYCPPSVIVTRRFIGGSVWIMVSASSSSSPDPKSSVLSSLTAFLLASSSLLRFPSPILSPAACPPPLS